MSQTPDEEPKPSSDRDLIEAAKREAADLPSSEHVGMPPADSFTGYEILREIHRGGQGAVFLAIQKSTKRKVAIKVMREGPFAGPRDRARFDREIQILGQLKHPNIVSIHDSGEAAGHYYYVMDYISGQPLDAWAGRGERSIEQCLLLFAKICEALNASHLRGVIHRDLKPGNIIIDSDDEPHILDFGLAKVTMGELGGESTPQLMTITGQFVGSLPWASPEQAAGSPEQIDMRTDVYSLGVILYQMLTGRFPYEVIGNMRDVLDNILRTEPAKPSTIRRKINDEIETIMLKCLSKERERRYQTAGELGRDVRHYLGGEPIEAKRASSWYIIRKSLRRHRSATITVAAFCAAFIAFGLYAFMQHRQDRANELVRRGIELAGLGRRAEALAKHDEALRIVPDHFKAAGHKAFLLKDEYFAKPFTFREPGMLKESLKYCEAALATKPESAGLWNLKAVLLMSLKDLPGAESACRETIRLDSRNHQAYSNLAKVLALQRRLAEAIEAAKKGTELAEEKGSDTRFDDGVWRTLAALQLHQGHAEAFASLAKAKQIDHRDTRNWLLLARLLLTLPGQIDHSLALDEAKHAKAFTGLQDPRFDRILAVAHLRNDQFEDAARHAEAAIAGGDRPVYGHLISAVAQARLGDRETARKQLALAREAWPEEFATAKVIVSAEKGLLWFDTLEELEALREQAEQLIN